MRLEMDPGDLARMLHHLDSLSEVAAHLMEPVARHGGEALRTAWWSNFTQEGWGEWADLADWTQDERAQLGYDPEHPILVRSGELADSVVNPGNANHSAQVDMTGAGTFVLAEGSEDIRYNLLHFGGWTALATYIPPRPMAVIHPWQEDSVAQAVDEAVGGVLRGLEAGA